MLQGLEWRKEECAARPDDVQEAGAGNIIARRNIKPFSREGMNGEAESGYECECTIVPASTYAALAGADGAGNALASMEAQAELYEEILAQREDQLAIMAAIAELYESRAEA